MIIAAFISTINSFFFFLLNFVVQNCVHLSQIRVVLLHQPAAAVPALGALLASYQHCGPFDFATSSPLEFRLHVAR
jgi:hypothetical protein